MGWLDRVSDQAGALADARELQTASRSAEACAALDRVLATTRDPYARADALIQRLCAVLNLGRTAEYTPAVAAAFQALRDIPEPYPHGHLNALAALAAHHQGALERCVTHLVQGARRLTAVPVGEADQDTAWAWHDLAMAYSYLGFHGYAVSAIERAREVGAKTGVPDVLLAAPGIRLRVAVHLDHNGDTDGCLRVLKDIGTDLSRHRHNGVVCRLRPSARAAYGYAAARLAALGGTTDLAAARMMMDAQDGARSRDLWVLGEVCLAIADGRPIEALTRLDTVNVADETLGAAEQARLRSLTLMRMGDHAAAHRADRYAFRLAAQRNDRLREVFVDGIAAQLDHQDLRRSVARHESEALTDPLTGLPNRRHLERYVAEMVARGERAVIGVCDLDGFKQVNTVHGHHSGDLVLQRVAGVIARVMRRGDVVARYGGDEFVVVLPSAGIGEAVEVARRIEAAVATEDWASLVPGTPVGVSVGWAEVGDGGDGLAAALQEAFETADREMLRAKTRPRAAS